MGANGRCVDHVAVASWDSATATHLRPYHEQQQGTGAGDKCTCRGEADETDRQRERETREQCLGTNAVGEGRQRTNAERHTGSAKACRVSKYTTTI